MVICQVKGKDKMTCKRNRVTLRICYSLGKTPCPLDIKEIKKCRRRESEKRSGLKCYRILLMV